MANQQRAGAWSAPGDELGGGDELVCNEIRRRDVRDSMAVPRHLREEPHCEGDKHRRKPVCAVDPTWHGLRDASKKLIK